jgi:hypothetical protein
MDKGSVFSIGHRKLRNLFGMSRGASSSERAKSPHIKGSSGASAQKTYATMKLAPTKPVQPSPQGIDSDPSPEPPPDETTPSTSTSEPVVPSKNQMDEVPRSTPRGSKDMIAGTVEDEIPSFLHEILSSQCKVQTWPEQDFELVQHLQEAVRNHGRVDKMKRLSTSEVLAVKRMPTRWVTVSHTEFRKRYPNSSERPWFDIGVVIYLNTVSYPYVCEFRGIYDDCTNMYVASSLARDGDLFKWCDLDIRPGPEREAKMRPLLAQLFAAVRWLHDLGIAHRDISLENVLLDNGRIKLIDFGMATFHRYTASVRGKLSYQAPEMHKGEYDSFLADAFAVGVVAFGMACQDYPWTSTKQGSCQLLAYVQMHGFQAFLNKRKARKGGGQRLSDLLSEDFVILLEGLISLDHTLRWSCGEKCYKGTGRMTVWDNNWLDDLTRKEVEMAMRI